MSVVTSPPVVWKRLDGYELKNIKKDFKIAEFERTASPAHINDIVQAILSNKFFDNVIRVVKIAGQPWALIDAQHRLQALWICYEKHGLKRYNLMLAVYPEQFARVIYRRLNMGKRLLQRDHSKALDDKKIPFFNELRPWLYHERTHAKNSYVEGLNALQYFRGKIHAVSIREIDSMLESVTRKDIEVMKLFCNAAKRNSPEVFGSFIYKVMIYRNVFKVGYENNFSEDDFLNLFDACQSNKRLLELVKLRRHQDLLVAYKIMVDVILPTIKRTKK